MKDFSHYRYWSITRAIDYLNNRTKPKVFLMIIIVWGISAFISIPPLLGWKQSPDLSWFEAIHSQKEAMNATTTEFGLYLTKEMTMEEFYNFTKVLEDVVFPKCNVSDEVGYVMYSALGSFYIPSCIMVFVYVKIYGAARARVRRSCKPNKEDEQLKGKPKRVLIGGPTVEVKRTYRSLALCGGRRRNGSVDQDSRRWSNGKSASFEGGNGNAAAMNGNNNGWQVDDGPSNSKDTLVDIVADDPSTDSGYQPPLLGASCGAGIIRPRNIFNRLKLGRRLSKDAREIIDTGRPPKVVGTNCSNGNNNGSTSIIHKEDDGVSSIEKEKRRLARQKERRATLILGLIMGAFIACWLPFFILYLVGPLCPICQPGMEEGGGGCCVDSWVFSVAFWLGYSNSALNPVIYTVFNKDFRQAFKKILFK